MISIKKVKEENNKVSFTAFDGNKIIGEISGEINNEILLIDNLLGSDFILDGLCRTFFSYCEKKGIRTGKFHENISDMAEKLSFFGEVDIKEYLLQKNCL